MIGPEREVRVAIEDDGWPGRRRPASFRGQCRLAIKSGPEIHIVAAHRLKRGLDLQRGAVVAALLQEGVELRSAVRAVGARFSVNVSCYIEIYPYALHELVGGGIRLAR